MNAPQTAARPTERLLAPRRPRVSHRTVVRWGVRHGLPGLVLDRAAKRGDLLGRLMRDAAVREQPYELYEQLRADGPLVSGALGPVTTSHALVQQVLRSEAFGVSWPTPPSRLLRRVLSYGDAVDVTGVIDPPSLLVIDPPDHTRLRRLVSKAFTPRAMAGFESMIERTAHRLLDDLETHAAADGGPVDLVDAYAAQLPVLVIAELLGVPTDRQEDFLRWGAAAAATLDPGLSFRRYAEAERGLREMHEFLRGHFERLRRDPGEDLVSRLVGLTGDEALTERELHATVMLLLGAGFETTVNLLGNAVVLLDAHRDQWEALRAAPEGWGNAVEEMLRYDSPVQITGRTARTDTELAGRAIPAGGRVTLLLGAANRDPEVFADPGRFDTTRADARDHLAFSAGAHYCIGAGLARLEGIVGLRVLSDRFPGLRVDGRPVRRDLQTLRGFEFLPVRLG